VAIGSAAQLAAEIKQLHAKAAIIARMVRPFFGCEGHWIKKTKLHQISYQGQYFPIGGM
jgi:hypothetical protein